MNNFNLDFMSARAQQPGDVVSLPQGQLRAAGSDAEVRHQWCVPGSLLDACTFPPCESGPFCLPCRLNNLRTTSITVVASASRAAVFSVVIGVCMTLLMMPR